jgi:hypothetical protein
VSRAFIVALVMMMVRVASAQEARISSSLELSGDTWVGQRVTMVVELFSPTYFSGTPEFDLPRVPSTTIFPPVDHPQLGTVKINNISYTFQRHELWIFGQRAGRIEIPSFPVRFEIAGVGGAAPSPVQLMTDPVSFDAKLPPGAEGLSTLISTSNLTVLDDWQPTDTAAKVGDAFTHHIILSAAGVPGMAFPPLPAVHVDGLGVYPKSPQVNDEINRGNLQGRRIETITYVCQSPGNYTVPAFTLTWWDLDDKVLKSAHISGRTFNVVPASVVAAAASSTWFDWRDRDLQIICAILVIIFAAIVIGWWGSKPLAEWRRAVRDRRLHSEWGLFAQVLKSCRAGDTSGIYVRLLAWWQEASPIERSPSLASFAQEHDEAALAMTVEALEQSLYADPLTVDNRTPVSFSQLGGMLKKMRKQMSDTAQLPNGTSRVLSLMNP